MKYFVIMVGLVVAGCSINRTEVVTTIHPETQHHIIENTEHFTKLVNVIRLNSNVKKPSNSLKNEIKDLAKNWRGNSVERGFSMSMDRFLGEIDQDSVLVLGYLNNELVGFLYFLSWGKVGFSLDRMQRAPKPLPGLTELMIENMITFCREKNYRYISLNFAAFRSVIERAEKISAGPILRTIRALIKLASGWFQVESLNRFNAKFQPNWHARYLLYPSLSEFAQVVWAILRAEKFISGFGARNKSGKGAK